MGVRVRQKVKGKGQPWWVFVSHNGQRTSKKVGSKKAALEVASQIEAKLKLGEFSFEEEKPTPTFQEYAKTWLALPHDWKESTKESYQFNLDKHILPIFGKYRLNEIKRKDLKGFFDNLLSNGMASATAKLVKAPINGVLSHAVDSELIDVNPLFNLKLIGKKSAFEVNPLTEEEADKLLEQTKKFWDGIYYPPLLCSLRTGMRIGEIKALKWEDVDFKNRLIEVKRSCRRDRITGTKNRKRRRIDMSPHPAETLRELKQSQWKKYAGKDVPQWVFTNSRGQMLTRIVFEKALNSCLKDAKLRRIRIHDLRHTYATIRLLRGHNVGDVSYQLGHSSIKITYDTYGHWIPGTFKSEVDELDNLHLNAPHMHPSNQAVKYSQSFQ